MTNGTKLKGAPNSNDKKATSKGHTDDVDERSRFAKWQVGWLKHAEVRWSRAVGA